MSYFITEKQINLIGRRLNNSKELGDELEIILRYAEEDGVRISEEQTQKGYAYLMDQYKSPRGIERKNNPFGIREMNMLDTGLFDKPLPSEENGRFYYKGHYDLSNMYHKFYVPLYQFVDKEGFSFEYYVSGGRVNIVG